jgi:transposase
VYKLIEFLRRIYVAVLFVVFEAIAIGYYAHSSNYTQAKHAKHWRERQRAQTILWLSEGKSVAEVATLQERIPETIRLQRRRWELYEFESIKEGHRSGRPNTLISDYQAKILDWVNTSPLNAEQIRVKLHEEYEVSVSVETIRKFLRDSGMVFKRTRHSLKKKRSDCI